MRTLVCILLISSLLAGIVRMCQYRTERLVRRRLNNSYPDMLIKTQLPWERLLQA